MVTSALFQGVIEVEPRAADLLAAAEVRSLRAGTSHQADSLGTASFVIVEEGFVVVRTALTQQRGVILCHAGPGALLAAPVTDQRLDALVDARVTLVSEFTYLQLLAVPFVATVLSDALRAALRQKQGSLANFGRVRHVERVQHKLLQLAEEHGRVVSGGIRLDFPITHDLLAEMVGSARETVSRAIDRLEHTGFLIRDGRVYRLQINPDAVGFFT